MLSAQIGNAASPRKGGEEMSRCSHRLPKMCALTQSHLLRLFVQGLLVNVAATLYPLSSLPQTGMLPPQTLVHHSSPKGKTTASQMLKRLP